MNVMSRPVYWILLCVTVWALMVCAISLIGNAFAHEMEGTNYANWTNQQGSSCCNGQDCKPLEDSEVRDDGKNVEVLIEHQWCIVRSWMYTKTGNAQRADVNHACILENNAGYGRSPDPCMRLICFRPSSGS